MRGRDQIDVSYLEWIIASYGELIEAYKKANKRFYSSPPYLNFLNAHLKAITHQAHDAHETIFSRYAAILNAINEARAHCIENKSLADTMCRLLMTELEKQKEAIWSETIGTIDQRITTAIYTMKTAASFSSGDHQLFCHKWNVSGEFSRYKIWRGKAWLGDWKTLRENLDNGYYGKIICELREAFGLTSSAPEKIRITEDIGIWTPKNLLIIYEKYLRYYAKLHPDTYMLKGRDCQKFFLRLANDIINPILRHLNRLEYSDHALMHFSDQMHHQIAVLIREQEEAVYRNREIAAENERLILRQEAIEAGKVVSKNVVERKPSDETNVKSKVADASPLPTTPSIGRRILNFLLWIVRGITVIFQGRRQPASLSAPSEKTPLLTSYRGNDYTKMLPRLGYENQRQAAPEKEQPSMRSLCTESPEPKGIVGSGFGFHDSIAVPRSSHSSPIINFTRPRLS